MADQEPTAIPPTGILPGAKRPVPGRSELVVMIAGLMALNAFGIDVMLPALNQIAHAVGLTAPGMESDNRQQMIIFSYVLGFGAPQIIWGPISDRFGRRGPLFVAIIGYIITAFACIVMRDFHALLLMRFTQGVFASGGRLVAVSIVRDLFAGRSMARFMSLVMTIFMVVPILAPGIGQLVLLFAPWEAIFVVLGIFGMIMLGWTWMRLPETLPESARQPLNLGAAMGAYGQILKSRVTFGYMCVSGVIFGQTETFALWFAGIAGTLACANFLNSRIVEKVGMRRISQTALFVFTIGAAVLSAISYFFGEHLYIFFPLFALCFGCFGLMGSNFSALAMEPLGKIAGTASAAYGFATTTVSSLIGMAISSQYNGSTIPITLGFVCLGLVSLVIILITEKGRLFSSR
ncbi:multidrug effflux MFS transporter [Hyphomonas oceanitis]|uniref:Bcr/CflA subfamily drug resistance transporter n=1 Tax=Hyphomonas oceanitis SCH89 TaxID=1280953 RepID=A0A059G7S7_9PROT|nr:multidrug effflux MFS transporter [Hyphomonas oceanitis]KDA02533.1 Bcr/CflA subfamily drug resistance transporter [Hyphomonas oceanitis SCH89]